MKLTVLFVILFLLSSCAQQIQRESDGLQSLKQQELSKIPAYWELSGRISIIHNQENWHARFYWEKQTNRFQLRFTGPLGETHLLLEQELIEQELFLAEKLIKNTLRIDNDVYISYGNVEDLLAEHSDIVIPLNSLQYWIFGRYNPKYPQQIKMISIDKSLDVIDELFQQDWKIQFSRYEQQPTASYPAKIIAKDGEYSIKVFVSSRRFNLNK
jgi:outer membrane lipoprotein LolB